MSKVMSEMPCDIGCTGMCVACISKCVAVFRGSKHLKDIWWGIHEKATINYLEFIPISS